MDSRACVAPYWPCISDFCQRKFPKDVLVTISVEIWHCFSAGLWSRSSPEVYTSLIKSTVCVCADFVHLTTKKCSTASLYWQVRRSFYWIMQENWQHSSVFRSELSLINWSLCCCWHMAKRMCVHFKINRKTGWQRFSDQYVLNLPISTYQHQKKIKMNPWKEHPFPNLALIQTVLIILLVCQTDVTLFPAIPLREWI